MEEYMYSKTSRDDDCFTGKIGNSGLEAESGSCRSLRHSPTPRGRGAAVTLEGLGVERKATAPQNKGSGGRTELAKGMGGQC